MDEFEVSTIVKNRTKALIGALTLWAVSSVANAAFITTWTDSIDQARFLTTGQTYSYTHDIRDNGFDVGLDLAYDFDLRIDLYDDGDQSAERARISLPKIPVLDLFSNSTTTYYELSGAEFGGWSLGSLLQLNTSGLLSVSVQALRGDFWVGDSRLDVHGLEATSVPEPGTLALLGMGLLATGFAARRRRSAEA